MSLPRRAPARGENALRGIISPKSLTYKTYRSLCKLVSIRFGFWGWLWGGRPRAQGEGGERKRNQCNHPCISSSDCTNYDILIVSRSLLLAQIVTNRRGDVFFSTRQRTRASKAAATKGLGMQRFSNNLKRVDYFCYLGLDPRGLRVRPCQTHAPTRASIAPRAIVVVLLAARTGARCGC
jgi:hypothetical protein